MACHPRATCHIAGCWHLANPVLWSQSYVSHCRVLPPGEFNGMSSQSHVSHCRVLPLGEFTVMIPEPHATLQGAVTSRNKCHDRATLQGVIIPSAILKIVFCHILVYFFWFLMQFGLWRAADFVSSPIHLLVLTYASGCSWWLHDVIRSFGSLEHKQLSTTCLASCQTQKHWKYKLPCCKSANQLHNRKFSLALIKV